MPLGAARYGTQEAERMTDNSPWANPERDDGGTAGSAEDTLADPPPGQPSPAETTVAADAVRGGSASLIPIFGLMLMVLIALGVALGVYVQRDTADRYPANSVGDDDPATKDKDEALDTLKAMGLRTSEVPPGLALRVRTTFTNGEWAALLASSDRASAGDPDALGRKTTQLDSQGRLANLVSVFLWDTLAASRQGQALAIISQSTIYKTEEAARADTGRLCGLRIDEKDPLTEFNVPKIGDQSIGFSVVSLVPEQGKTVDTVVCFRTGRIVHGVVQTSYDGSQNIGLVVALAQRMEAHVALTFQHKPEPVDADPERQG